MYGAPRPCRPFTHCWHIPVNEEVLLLHKWNGNSAPVEPVGDYGSATDDELFKILDAELGS